uniref:Uncharacterized protein n=1 Tax=Tanacetum cinerariifolium TaxID=118510 RepID=A0A6L2MHG0_TANCI|nr:hypothetical protein [Tanacetum cinerariifolium]
MSFPHLQELAAAQNSNNLSDEISVYIERKINDDLYFAAGLSHLWEFLYCRVNEHKLLIAKLNVFGGPLALQCAEFLTQLSQTEVLKMLEIRKSIAEIQMIPVRLYLLLYYVHRDDEVSTWVAIFVVLLLIHHVSKQWLRIITSPIFIKNPSQITKVDPPVGLFVNHIRSLFESDFVPLDPRLRSKKSAMDRSFSRGSTEEADNAGSENRPPMLNKENYVPWSSRLLRRIIPEPGDTNCEVLVNETFHVQTNEELTEKELKQIEADDQSIQTILLGLPEDIYAAVDSYETAQEIWLRVQQMMKGSNIGIQEKKAKLFNEWQRPNGKLIHNSIINGSYVRRMIPEPGDPNCEVPVNETFHVQIDDELTKKELKQIEADDQAIQTILLGLPKDIYAAVDSCETAQEIWLLLHQDQPSFNRNYMQQPMPNPEGITDPITTMNMELALVAKAFKLNYSTPTNNNQRISSNPRNRQIVQLGNLNGYNGVQNVRNQVIQNAVQNPRIQNVGNQNGQTVVSKAIQNPNRNGTLVAARGEGNATGYNGNQIRCYNCRGFSDLDEIEEVNANCILMENLQQALTSEEQYTELLEPILESHQVPQNDNNVISKVTSVEQNGETVEQHPANVEETRVLYDSLYHNLAIEVEKVNTVNRKLRETNAELTTELVRFKNDRVIISSSSQENERRKKR